MSKKEILQKTFVEISRILLGITFIFSGFVKSVDPLGTTYKIQDYITTFGFDSLLFLALPLSITLCVLEFSLGVSILLGIYRKWTARLILLVMLFMTPLTLYLAIANPVADCGCFGDALIITNWQTFYKNAVLLAAAIMVFLYHEQISNFYSPKFYWLVATFIIGSGFLFTFYNYYFEPILDFRPYKVGANLPKLMSIEEGKGDVYQNIFIYEKDGVKQEFDEDNYPWEDSTWTFVDRTNKLIKEGEKPVIHDFKINQLFFNTDKTTFVNEEDITTEVLEDDGYTFLMIAYSLKDMRDTNLSKFEDISNYANDHQYRFYCLTSSTREDIIEWEKENSLNFTFCLTDERTLKTMVRSNPGLFLIKKGIILNKWDDSQVPSEVELTKPLEKLEIVHSATENSKEEKNRILTFVVLFCIPLIGIKALDLLFYRRKAHPERE